MMMAIDGIYMSHMSHNSIHVGCSVLPCAGLEIDEAYN